ncbi:hypothetical protein [Streptomyces sp. NBC_00503]|uniref:hypothetical protein n=1 Tax=Streptomyces sp. NBC_00503 TaxID=2903659 RepID=UPI002E7FF4B9|nr:hypothetical protein [Streptomyces sp. NBC_00503]WUD84375.1 hypothetical protein OG490_29570 [Streptomyces sp. NBC_00503]
MSRRQDGRPRKVLVWRGLRALLWASARRVGAFRVTVFGPNGVFMLSREMASEACGRVRQSFQQRERNRHRVVVNPVSQLPQFHQRRKTDDRFC